MPHEKKLSIEELRQHFHLPIVEVSKKLNVCCTVLKKICRKNGIKRWPSRKFKSLDTLLDRIQEDEQVAEETRTEWEKLKKKRELLVKNPNASARVSHLARKVGSTKAQQQNVQQDSDTGSSGSDNSAQTVCGNTAALFSALDTVMAEEKMVKEQAQAEWEAPRSVSIESLAEIATTGKVVDPRLALAALKNSAPQQALTLPSFNDISNPSFALPPLNMALKPGNYFAMSH